MEVDIPQTNVIENIIQTKKVYSKQNIDDFLARPRPSPKMLGNKFKHKTVWDFHLSIFRDYKPDNKALLLKCFDFDWENNKLETLIKKQADREQVRSIL
jgi:hypothetical protein